MIFNRFLIVEWYNLWRFGISICLTICNLHQKNLTCGRRQCLAFDFLQQCECYATFYTHDDDFWRISGDFSIWRIIFADFLVSNDTWRHFWVRYWLCDRSTGELATFKALSKQEGQIFVGMLGFLIPFFENFNQLPGGKKKIQKLSIPTSVWPFSFCQDFSILF